MLIIDTGGNRPAFDSAITEEVDLCIVASSNHHRGKRAALAKQDQHRFERFLGGSVTYTKLAFEAFAAVHGSIRSTGFLPRTLRISIGI